MLIHSRKLERNWPLGRRVEAIAGDIGNVTEVESICRSALERVGAIDILINNVGGRRISIPTEELSLKDWQQILDLNLTGPFSLLASHRKGHDRAQRGSIINVTSIAGIIVNKGIYRRTYETAKAALTAFTKTLAVDWRCITSA